MDAGIIVIVDGDTVMSVCYGEVEGTIVYVFEFCHAFTGGDNFSFT